MKSKRKSKNKNENILVFGGTTEGREIARCLKETGRKFYLSVATDYSRDVVEEDINLLIKRMSDAEMNHFIKENHISLAIDATHPYAAEVSANVRKACEDTQTKLIRVIREESEKTGRYFDTHADCAAYLAQTQGNIFLAIGSKELKAYTSLANYRDRIYLRILPMVESLENALALGFKNANIFCLQGRFSKEMNIEFLKLTQSKFLVTKDSGKSGGMAEKQEAAKEYGAELLVIGRKAEEGLSLTETLNFLKDGEQA